MKRMIIEALIVGAAFVSVAGAAETPQGASLADKPVARKDGKAVRISFAVTAPVDVEVSILAADGTVVRRLAAGLLGDNAPEPFRKGLCQELLWDGLDDSGKEARGVKVRVSLGMTPKLERIIGWSGQKLGGVRGLMILGTDGSVPKNLLGPEVCPRVGGFGHIALSPDEKYVYATGFVSTGSKGTGPQNVVYRVALDSSENSKVFIGGELDAKSEAVLDDPHSPEDVHRSTLGRFGAQLVGGADRQVRWPCRHDRESILDQQPALALRWRRIHGPRRVR
jgi:hypothetical protein